MKGEKSRERIVATALRLFHERGYANTSLADVAVDAGLLKGNLAYYFKTKPDLLAAVTEARLQLLWQTLSDGSEDVRHAHAEIAAKGTAYVCVSRLLDHVQASASELAMLGCPLGSLSTELGKVPGELHPAAARSLTELLGWLQEQFAEMFEASIAARYAEHLLTCVQGAAVVAQATRDSGVVVRQIIDLRRWLDEICLASAGSAESRLQRVSERQ